MMPAGSIEDVKDCPREAKLSFIIPELFVVVYLVCAIEFHAHFLLDVTSSLIFSVQKESLTR